MEAVDVEALMYLSEPQNQEYLVNVTPGQFTMIDKVILPDRVGETVPPCIQVILPACLWVDAALQWVNYNAVLNVSATHIQVNTCNDALKWIGTCVQVNDAFQWMNELMTYLPVNVFAPKTVVMKLDCLVVANVRKNKLCDTMCQYHNYAMYKVSYCQDLPILMASTDTLWRSLTAKYEVEDYPAFVFHPREYQFLNLSETLKSYAYYLSQYRLIWVAEFVIHWCSHLCHFIVQNIALLVNFDLTPQQHCRNAHLTACQAQYYKHDFAVMSGRNVSTNIVAASVVKYFENMFGKIFWHKYNYITFAFINSKNKSNSKGNSKGNFKDKTHNCFTSLEISPPNKIGGGHSKISVEKLEMQLINPYKVFAPAGYSDFATCEFIEHLEMSKALTQFDNSIYIVCDVPLDLLVTCLFRENIISIAQQHNIPITMKMKKSEITEKVKIHGESCEHQYVSVFCLYNKMTNSERCQTYCEMQKPLVEKAHPTEQSINQDFPPAPPDTLLRKKIIDEFCKATAPAKFEEAGCAVCGVLTLQTELSDLSSDNIDLSVLNTTGYDFTRKERKHSTEPISELDGPAVDTSCHYICVSCKQTLRHKKMPKFALARGLWLGEVPDELKQLSFAEKLLIGRVRHI